MLNKIKKVFNKTKGVIDEKKLAITTCATMFLTSAIAFAAPKTVVTGNLVKTIVDYIFEIFFYIGVFLLAWSIGSMVLAFKNEDADSKSRAAMTLVVSILLMGIGTVFNGLNLL